MKAIDDRLTELSVLDKRSRDIFRRLVETFLETGGPVGSRTISRHLPVGLSPASIRNVMSDLEPGFIGIAIRVRCQLSGDLFWLWGNPQGRRKEYPPPSCYLYDNSSPPMLILSTL